MNVSLEYTYYFSAITRHTGAPMLNHYTMVVDLLTNTDDGVDQNIAFQRLSHWINNVLNDSVLLDEEDETRVQYDQLDHRVLEFPIEPVDQVVGLLLMKKLNAIMEDRLLVMNLKINSVLGNNMTYCINCEDNAEELDFDGWWHDSDPSYKRHQPVSSGNVQVVALFKSTHRETWKDHQLQWNDPENQQTIVDFDEDH